MTKPIIGITANVRPNPAHEDINWSYAPSGFVEGVQKAGGLAILLPVSDPSEAKNYISSLSSSAVKTLTLNSTTKKIMPVKMTSSLSETSLRWH